MITRIYRVQIVPELRAEFELQFHQVASEFIEGRPGLVSCEIAGPTVHSPDEYLMITKWTDLDAVIAFAGDAWHEPVIPDHMRKYTRECWLHHYESFE